MANNTAIYNQASTLANSVDANPVKVIAVTGGKGGVGKTNVSTNLAIALAKQNKKVMLFDADLGLANIDVLLGLKANQNLTHVLQQQMSIDDILMDGPAGIKIVPAASGLQHMANLSSMEHANIIHAFSNTNCNPDYLIIDTAAGISEHVISFSKAAHDIFVVVCNEPTSITDAYAYIKVMNRDHGINRFQVIANMVEYFEEGRHLFFKLSKAADKFLDVTLQFFGSIPFDDMLRKAVQQQSDVISKYPNSRSALAFKQLAKKVDTLPNIEQAQGHISFFIDRFIHNHRDLQELVT